jgi:hypothetical protein
MTKQTTKAVGLRFGVPGVSLKPYSHWLIIAVALLVVVANRAYHPPGPSNKCLEPRSTLTRDEIFHCRLRGYHLRNR